VTETVSGSVAIAQRRGFARLLDRLEAGDVLVVTKLDRLGRNAMDVGSTVARLADHGVRVHCLALTLNVQGCRECLATPSSAYLVRSRSGGRA